MKITQIIENIRRSIGRMALMGTLAAVMITGLAACGSGTTATDSGSNSAANVATSEPTATAMTSDSSAAATDTPGNMGVMDEAPTQTPADTSNDVATPTQQPASQGSGNVAQINATLREWAIDLSQKEVAAGKIQFTVTNQGRMAHNLTVLDSNGNQIGQTPVFGSSDGPQTLEVNLTAGTYTLICSLPGHAQRGQTTELVVK